MRNKIFDFTVPEQKQIRLIVNTDAKNEADDQFAIVHALLTQKFNIKSIIAAHFGTHRGNDSMQQSYDEIIHVLELLNMKEVAPVLHGTKHAIKDIHTPAASEGADNIIKEAMSDDPAPLFCIFLGPLTDMASAILLQPEICEKKNVTVVWIGGNAWPDGGPEFNMQNDVDAVRVVYDSGINLWQIPRNVYNLIKVSLSELQIRVKPYGAIGNYLFTQMIEFNDKLGENPGWPLGESWVLGDSAAIGVLLDEHEFCFKEVPSPRLGPNMEYIHNNENKTIRMYHDIDVRFIMEDFYAKLALHTASN